MNTITNNVIKKIKQLKIISVMLTDKKEEALDKGDALIKGGIQLLELTLTISEASSVIRYFANGVLNIL
ncbi:hypothetical protein [Metabacillus idriensis]|uniref:hypothetical protein n=1 Tax=Metabacillus idriensis TaxID=324768 RepID=UPI001748E868|nr:hypothetical protein [Metabacillus idriensis]